MSEKDKESPISVKVRKDEKELLQKSADALNVSLSEYIRIKALSDYSGTVDLYHENHKIKEELKELRIKQSYFSKLDCRPDALVLPTNQKQKEIILKVFGSFYQDGREPEMQILNFLIDDATYPHWQLPSDFKIVQGIHFYVNNREVYLKSRFKLSTWASLNCVALDTILNEFEGFVFNGLESDDFQ